MTKKASRSDIGPVTPAEYDFWYFDADATKEVSLQAELPRLKLPGSRVGIRRGEGDRRRP
ncbi:hypothetical protein [Mesorhizobium sp. CN2-181]|uniref:hypothetical protein n=1 Tax=Mesorhizobium yinganensis TaxID=3157707 RepID=UPI0032B7C766